MENPNVIEASSPKKYFFVKYLAVFILAIGLAVLMWTSIGIIQSVMFIFSMFVIQHALSWFRRCYKVDFSENGLVFYYNVLLWEHHVGIPYDRIDAIYGTYLRNPKKNYVKFVYKKQYANFSNLWGMITNLISSHGWSESDLAKISEQISLHSEISLRRIEMK